MYNKVVILCLLCLLLMVLLIFTQRFKNIDVIEKFTSLKSNIRNFNETTEISDTNEINAYNSNIVGTYQKVPMWIYPYIFIDREFIKILSYTIDKINESNFILSSNKRDEQISQIIKEINRYFNLDKPIIGVKPDDPLTPIQETGEYNINIYKIYMKPESANISVKIDGERCNLTLLSPQIIIPEKWKYVTELDNLFYLAKSKDPTYRMLSNTEARDLYVKKVTFHNSAI